MKRFIAISTAVISVISALPSCQKAERTGKSGGEGPTFTASIGDDISTRTVIDGNRIHWVSGDEISINGSVYTAEPDDTKPTTATFTKSSGEIPSGPYTAYYPASIYDGENTVLPAVQEHGDFSMNPMYAYSENKTLSFKNICAVLKITVPSNINVKAVKVTADKAMNGAFEVVDNVAVMTKTSGLTKEDKTVTLNCGSGMPGTDFYIAVPAGDYSGSNLKITVVDSDTYEHEQTTNQAATIIMERNTVYHIPFQLFEYTATASTGVIELSPNSGTAYIYIREPVENLTIRYRNPSSMHLQGNVFIIGNGNKVTNLDIQLPYSHVELQNGESETVTSQTWRRTLVIKNDYRVGTGVTVISGGVKAEGYIKEVIAPSDMPLPLNLTIGDNPEAQVDIATINNTLNAVVIVPSSKTEPEYRGTGTHINDPAAEIDDVYFGTLDEALETAWTYSWTHLLKDYDATSDRTLKAGEYYIDLNGHTYTATGVENAAFVIRSGSTLRIQGGTIVSDKACLVFAPDCSGSSLRVGQNTTLTSMSSAAVMGCENASGSAANSLVLAGIATSGGVEGITINASTNEPGAAACGIYCPWIDNFMISSCTFHVPDGSAIVASSGSLDVSGCNFSDVTGTGSGTVGTSETAIPMGKWVVLDHTLDNGLPKPTLNLSGNAETVRQLILSHSVTLKDELHFTGTHVEPLVEEPLVPSKSMVSGGTSIKWEPSDEISLIFGSDISSPKRKMVSSNTTNVQTAEFLPESELSALEVAATDYWGLYPYYSSSSYYNGLFLRIPETQTGVPGSFDKNTFVAAAHSTDGTDLEFKNVCGGFKFSLSRADICKITLTGNNNEILAGNAFLQISEMGGQTLDFRNTSQRKYSISLTPKEGGTFAKDEYYYLVVAPGSFSNGFTLTFETTVDKIGTLDFTTSTTISRSKFKVQDNIDQMAAFTDWPYGKENGKDWVRLWEGGPKWAKVNVGATSATAYGKYYPWGKTSYSFSNYNWQNYCNSDNFTEWVPIPHTDYLMNAGSTYDAARSSWGGKWRIPTSAEFQALLDNCYLYYVTTYGGVSRNGYIAYRAKDASHKGNVYIEHSGKTYGTKIDGYSTDDPHIFLEVCGLKDGISSGTSDARHGYYWTRNVDNANTSKAKAFLFTYSSLPSSMTRGLSSVDRKNGCNIRPICD